MMKILEKRKALKLVRSNGNYLKTLSDEMKSDKDVVLQAIKNVPSAFQYASLGLRSDIDFILSIIKFYTEDLRTYPLHRRGHKILRWAVDSLKENKEFMLEAISHDYFSFFMASRELVKDKNFVIQSVNINPKVLEFKPQFGGVVYTDDAELMLELEKSTDNFLLGFTSDRLRSDKKFILGLINIDKCGVDDLSSTLLSDKDVILAAVQKDPTDFLSLDASNEMKQDRDIAIASLKYFDNKIIYPELSEDLKNDRELVIVAVSSAGTLFNSLQEHHRDDKEIVLAAISGDEAPGADIPYIDFSKVSERLQRDTEVIAANNQREELYEKQREFMRNATKDWVYKT